MNKSFADSSIESKTRLLYNKATKEMMVIISGVEEGSETYSEVRKLVQNIVEIELKKLVDGRDPVNIETAEDITPQVSNITQESGAVGGFIKNAVNEPLEEIAPTKDDSVTKTNNIANQIEVKQEQGEETTSTNVADNIENINTTSSNTEPVLDKNNEADTAAKIETADLTPASNDPTFLIKAGDTQLSVKDFAEANRLLQPRFMSGGKFRVAMTEIAIYEQAGYTHP